MIVLDTTVLLYAKGSDHELREPCRRLISAVASEEVGATTTIEVIQEATHVRARRRGKADAADLARAYAELLAPLLIVTDEHLMRGLEIFERIDPLGAFDAVLAAAAIHAGATHLVSADRAFSELPGIAHVFPDEAGISTLVA